MEKRGCVGLSPFIAVCAEILKKQSGVELFSSFLCARYPGVPSVGLSVLVMESQGLVSAFPIHHSSAPKSLKKRNAGYIEVVW